MLNQHIQHWLNHQGSYLEGLKLHAQIGQPRSHHSLRQYLSFPHIPAAAHDLLTTDLRAYLLAHPVQAPTPAAPAPTPAPEATAPTPADATLSKLQARAKALLKERDAHRAQLVQMVTEADKFTDNDRFLLCEAIMAVQEEVDETYQQIETYRTDGVVPEPGLKKRHVRETVEKYQRLQSLRSSMSRLRARLKKKPSDQQRQLYETELLAKQVEAQQLEDDLGLHD